MPVWLEIILAFIGSSGIWTLITTVYLKKQEKRSLTNKMLLGLGHDKIMYLCEKYLDRGYVTHEEYENLYDYLYVPYKEMGGNGAAIRAMEMVSKLPDHPINGD
jgi:hypothetical protein